MLVLITACGRPCILIYSLPHLFEHNLLVNIDTMIILYQAMFFHNHMLYNFNMFNMSFGGQIRTFASRLKKKNYVNILRIGA